MSLVPAAAFLLLVEGAMAIAVRRRKVTRSQTLATRQQYRSKLKLKSSFQFCQHLMGFSISMAVDLSSFSTKHTRSREGETVLIYFTSEQCLQPIPIVPSYAIEFDTHPGLSISPSKSGEHGGKQRTYGELGWIQ